MLHRSFKPAKCKTSLKLAVSRIKLLKNKKDAQVKQIRRELAQLLETGQDRTARIRVEHVVREEKTKAAFELIEIYCELIAARLPMIESQKNCPIDLKEAITSVVFASPRCADIPELMDVRKHFTAKYGKEFISNAVELRPDCGVSRMLVEKLSAKSPDGPAKMKILAAIAEEHNVKWDPEALEEKESKPPEDLLNGPNTFGRIPAEPYLGPPPPNHDVKAPSNAQVPPQNYGNYGPPSNFNEQNARSSPRFQDSASSNVSSNKATTSGSFHSEVRSSGNQNDGMENRHLSPEDGSSSSPGRQSWNMHFKDAASAAQAAAESAEMASMAARAAAELSRKHSSESRDKFSQSASLASSRTSTNAPSASSHQMQDRYPHQMADRDSQNKSSETEKRDFTDEVRMKRQSSNTNVQASEMQSGVKPDNISHFDNARSEEKSSRPSSHSNSMGEVSTKRQSSNTDVTYGSEMQTGNTPANMSYFGGMRSEEKSSRPSSLSNSSFGSEDQEDVLRGNLEDMRTGEQSMRSSSHSHSRNFSNDHENVSNGSVEESFVNDVNIFQSTKETNSYGNAALVFDDSGSDDDKSKFEVEDNKGQESSLFFPSPDRNSFSPSADLDPWSSRQQADEVQFKSSSQLSSSSVKHLPPVFSENLAGSMDSPQPTGLLPVAFDASDGSSSDSEEELDKLAQSTVSKISPMQSQSASHRSLGSSSSEEIYVGSNRKPGLLPSFRNLESAEVPPERSQRVENRTVQEENYDFDELPTGRPSVTLRKSGLDSNARDDVQASHLRQTMKDSEISEGCSCVEDTDNELSLGMLTGGLRNKGLRHPPYTKKLSGNSSSVKQDTGDTKVEQPSFLPSVRTSVVSEREQGSKRLIKERSTRTPVSYVASDDDSSEDELSHRTVRSSQDSIKLIQERSARTPVSYVASDDDSSEDEVSHRTVRNSQNSFNKKLGPEVKASSKSTFSFFDSEDSEPEEDLLTKISTSNARPSARLSRRTQPSSNSVRSSSSKTTVVSDVSGTSDYGQPSSKSSYATEIQLKPSSQTKSSDQEWNRPVEQAAPGPVRESKRVSPVETSNSNRNSSLRSFNSNETLPKPLSQTKSSERPRSQEWHKPVEQVVPKPMPESKRSSLVETSKSHGNPSSRSSYATESLQKPLSQTRSSERPGSQEWHRPAEQVAPKPIRESKRSSPEDVKTSKSFGNSSSRTSYATETLPNPSSQTKSLERPGRQERPTPVEQAAPKPVLESRRSSSHVETSKPFAREQSSEISQKIETSKSSGSTESSSKEKASHVHPKLPDSDDIIAKFMALRKNRQRIFRKAMEKTRKQSITGGNPTVLQSQKLQEYILKTSVYPREPNALKELRIAAANHPMAFMSTSPDSGQFMALLLKLVNPKKAIEIGVFSGYSLLLTALTIPDDGKITAIDIDRKAYEMGLPSIKKAGVENKIDFIESPAMPILDELLEEPEKEGSFDFAFVDADKNNYWNYHQRLMKLIKVGGMVMYDNTLWGGTVAWPEEDVPEAKREWRRCAIEFNELVSADARVEISQVPLGDGITICRRVC
ncbi:hypothetical protein ACFX14_026333 [Malus domestica]